MRSALKVIPVYVLFALLTGVLVTVMGVSFVIERIIHHEETVFNGEANRIHDALARGMSATEESLQGLYTLFDMRGAVDAEQFRQLSEDMLHRHPHIKTVSYMPRLDHESRRQFESAMDDDGYVGFQVRERIDGASLPAPERPLYYPVRFQEPLTPSTAGQLGFDMLSVGHAAASVHHAIDEGVAVFLWPAPHADNSGLYMLIRATYAGVGAPKVQEQRRALANGLIALTVDAGALLDDLILDRHIMASMRVIFHGDNGGAVHFSRSGGELFNEVNEHVLTRIDLNRPMSFPGYDIELNLQKELHWEDSESWPVVIAIIAGVILTALLIMLARVYVLRELDLQRRQVEIQDKVDVRTHELSVSNRQLHETARALEQEKKEQQALITQLQEAHAQLLQSEKMASIGVLAAGVAHEINNPVAYVYSNLGSLHDYCTGLLRLLEAYESLRPQAANDPHMMEAVEHIREEIDLPYLRDDLLALVEESRNGLQRVREIVSNLKNFSRVGEAEWQMSDLHSGIDSTLSIVHNELKYKAEVVKEYGELPLIECIPSQLNQVIMNLLVNAAHAIEERGTITLRTGTEGDEVWLEISDTGKGIAPENMKKIFDPFFTTKPVGSGTGLGLSVSFGIIEKHHGRIEVKSQVGVGTTFTVHLPVEQSGEAAAEVARSF